MNEEKHYEPTTFNMDIQVKTKAKVHIAQTNMKVREGKLKDKINLGKLLNDSLDHYLSQMNTNTEG